MADNENNTSNQQSAWVQANMGESFTQAFNIRKIMYRIQDVDLPFKRGIRVEQFLMFLLALVVAFIFNNIILYPLMRLGGISLPWTFHAVIWLAFPVFMAIRIGKPMPHHKTITGMAASFLRYNLDDRWHSRGLPVKKAPKTGLQGNYLRTWTVDPAFQGVESPSDLPATDFALYTNLDLPDGAVFLPEEVVEKQRILEDEESFLDRLTGRSSIGRTEEVAAQSDAASLATESGRYVMIEDQAPVFTRDSADESERI